MLQYKRHLAPLMSSVQPVLINSIAQYMHLSLLYKLYTVIYFDFKTIIDNSQPFLPTFNVTRLSLMSHLSLNITLNFDIFILKLH